MNRPGPSTQLILLWLVTVFAAPREVGAVPTIEVRDAGSYIGRRATVCGEVTSTLSATDLDRQPTFLNFEKYSPDHLFSAVIWASYRNRFPRAPEDYYRDALICVTGEISADGGIPLVVVSRPKQIEIVSKRQAIATPPLPVRPSRDCTPRARCCKVCTSGKACGNTCISASYNCHKGRGCACNSWEVCR